jgi:hypothetical protein
MASPSPAPAPAPAPAAQPSRPARKPTKTVDRVVIRSLPEVVYLYPTMIAAALGSLMTWQGWGSGSLWGDVFLVVFGLNLIVVAFDFPRTTSLTLFFLVVAIILGAIMLNDRKEFLPSLQNQTEKFHPSADAQFYFIIAFVLALILVVVFIIHTWFDYWEVSSNELIHHHGVLGSLERLPSPGIKLDKDITDVFEYFLLGAGRLVITPTGEGRPIVLNNVPRIQRVESQIKQVLGVTDVQIRF